MKLIFKISLLVFVTLTSVWMSQASYAQTIKSKALEQQVFYHIFLRSFYDSNGDSHGDLNGLIQKLDYLQKLGITSVLLTPLYHSDFYHNYFPIDFEEIDPEFGTKDDYFALLKEMHQRGMKLYLDMEIHYVTEDHLWYRDSYQNPSSQYGKYIIYNGPNNTNPEPIIYNLTELKSYDGKIIKCGTIDLYNQKVREYMYKLFRYWVDPNNDGNFDDGIDGFRLDHIMDDLDWKGKLTGLLSNFWRPLFQQLREINPNIVMIYSREVILQMKEVQKSLKDVFVSDKYNKISGVIADIQLATSEKKRKLFINPNAMISLTKDEIDCLDL